MPRTDRVAFICLSLYMLTMLNIITFKLEASKINLLNGTCIDTIGTVSVALTFKEMCHTIQFKVLSTHKPINILGREGLN